MDFNKQDFYGPSLDHHLVLLHGGSQSIVRAVLRFWLKTSLKNIKLNFCPIYDFSDGFDVRNRVFDAGDRFSTSKNIFYWSADFFLRPSKTFLWAGQKQDFIFFFFLTSSLTGKEKNMKSYFWPVQRKIFDGRRKKSADQ